MCLLHTYGVPHILSLRSGDGFVSVCALVFLSMYPSTSKPLPHSQQQTPRSCPQQDCKRKYVTAFHDSKIKFPLPHRILKSQFKNTFVAERPNTCY